MRKSLLTHDLGLGLGAGQGGSFYADWPLAFDFVNNKYRVGIGRGYSSSFLEQPGVTYARTGADLLSYNPVTGKWQAFAANAPALLTGAGQDIPEGTTNKCTNYNAAPQALVAPTTAAGFNAAGVTGVSASGGDANTRWSVVDDTAALRAAGFGDLIDAGKMNGRVFCIDNSAGAAPASFIFSGGAAAATGHVGSIIARGVGSALVNTGLTTNNAALGGGAGYIGAAYNRIWRYGVVNVGSTLKLNVNAGDVVWLCLNQLEEKTYATNPVIVSGVAATRGNAQPVVTGLSSILTPPFTLVAAANLSAIDGVTRYLATASAAGSGNNRLRVLRNSANEAEIASVSGGVSTNVRAVAGYTGPRLLKMASRVRVGSAMASISGALGSEVSLTNSVGLDRLDLGVVNGAASGFLNSPLLFVGIAPDLTDAQLQAITASNGALTDFL